jgi:hypothetical protein
MPRNLDDNREKLKHAIEDLEKLFWCVDGKVKDVVMNLEDEAQFLKVQHLEGQVRTAKRNYKNICAASHTAYQSGSSRELAEHTKNWERAVCGVGNKTMALLNELDGVYAKKQAKYADTPSVENLTQQVAVLREQMIVLRDYRHFFQKATMLADRTLSLGFQADDIRRKRGVYLDKADAVMAHAKLDKAVRVPHKFPLGFLKPQVKTHSIDAGPKRAMSEPAKKTDSDEPTPVTHYSV